jgi:hypothetical protein
MIVADAFMGVYFSAPNPDVDSKKWIDTLERMLELDIEILQSWPLVANGTRSQFRTSRSRVGSSTGLRGRDPQHSK